MNFTDTHSKKARPGQAAGENAFLLAHISDPHLTSLVGIHPRSLLNKRLFGYLSWYRRRRYIHSPQILEAFQTDFEQVVPDHLVVSGDLTHLGLPDEFDQAAHWLRELGSAQRITVVPGNHDAYVTAPWLQTFAKWTPYLAGDQDGSVIRFPTLRIRGQIALLGLSSARPSPPFFASGRLGRAQLARLEELLEQTARQGLLRIVALHHPPLAGSIDWRKRLTDSTALVDVLARQGAELILHGHTHFFLTRELLSGDWRIPVLGVPSVSAKLSDPRRAASYHLFRFAQQDNAWHLELEIRTYSPSTQNFHPLAKRSIFLP